MGSLLKLIVLIAGFCVARIEANALSELVNQQGIRDLLLRTREVASRDPQRSMRCFGIYTPLLDNLTASFKNRYTECENSTRNEVSERAREYFRRIERYVNVTSKVLFECGSKPNLTDYFSCFADRGEEHKNNIYNITLVASDGLHEILEGYRLVELRIQNCTTEAERAFVESTGRTYGQLQICLDGGNHSPSAVAAPAGSSPAAPAGNSTSRASARAQKSRRRG